MRNLFIPAAQAAELIRAGNVMVVSGTEELLASLPHGRWVGGTTVYFMTADGGKESSTHVFCTIVDEAEGAHVRLLPEGELSTLADGRYATGFTYLMLPGFSPAHRRFALEAAGYSRLYEQPVMGWITGVKLSDIGVVAPKVFDGSTGHASDNAGVALYCQLAHEVEPDLDIVNLFTQGNGPTLTFRETTLEARECYVNGTRVNFARWLVENQIDTKLPLVANYAGAMINVSIQDVNEDQGVVRFYAPVVEGEQYRIATPVADYAKAYSEGLGATTNASASLSCNCVLNYLYAGLEGKTTSGFVGPVTFGEVAYILLNQTLARLNLVPASATAIA